MPARSRMASFLPKSQLLDLSSWDPRQRNDLGTELSSFLQQETWSGRARQTQYGQASRQSKSGSVHASHQFLSLGRGCSGQWLLPAALTGMPWERQQWEVT